MKSPLSKPDEARRARPGAASSRRTCRSPRGGRPSRAASTRAPGSRSRRGRAARPPRERVVELSLVLDGMVQLVAELADVGDAQRAAPAPSRPSISRPVKNGNASRDTSARVSDAEAASRDRGPARVSTPYRSVTSWRDAPTRPRAGGDSSQSRSCVCGRRRRDDVEAIRRRARVTVRSHSMPPFGVHICVSAIRPYRRRERSRTAGRAPPRHPGPRPRTSRSSSGRARRRPSARRRHSSPTASCQLPRRNE